MPPNEPAPSTANTALLAANLKRAASARGPSAKMPMIADTLGEFSPPCIDRARGSTPQVHPSAVDGGKRKKRYAVWVSIVVIILSGVGLAAIEIARSGRSRR